MLYIIYYTIYYHIYTYKYIYIYIYRWLFLNWFELIPGFVLFFLIFANIQGLSARPSARRRRSPGATNRVPTEYHHSTAAASPWPAWPAHALACMARAPLAGPAVGGAAGAGPAGGRHCCCYSVGAVLVCCSYLYMRDPSVWPQPMENTS